MERGVLVGVTWYEGLLRQGFRVGVEIGYERTDPGGTKKCGSHPFYEKNSGPSKFMCTFIMNSGDIIKGYISEYFFFKLVELCVYEMQVLLALIQNEAYVT